MSCHSFPGRRDRSPPCYNLSAESTCPCTPLPVLFLPQKVSILTLAPRIERIVLMIFCQWTQHTEAIYNSKQNHVTTSQTQRKTESNYSFLSTGQHWFVREALEHRGSILVCLALNAWEHSRTLSDNTVQPAAEPRTEI